LILRLLCLFAATPTTNDAGTKFFTADGADDTAESRVAATPLYADPFEPPACAVLPSPFYFDETSRRGKQARRYSSFGHHRHFFRIDKCIIFDTLGRE
jgi:hypothetical protein